MLWLWLTAVVTAIAEEENGDHDYGDDESGCCGGTEEEVSHTVVSDFSRYCAFEINELFHVRQRYWFPNTFE